MKKVLILAILFLGCSEDDEQCECTLEVTITGESSYFVTGVPTDCDGNIIERPSNVPPEHFIIGCTN